MERTSFWTKVQGSRELKKFIKILSILKKDSSESLFKFFPTENCKLVFYKRLEFFQSRFSEAIVQFLVFKKIANIFKKKKKSQAKLFFNKNIIIIWEPFLLLTHCSHVLKTNELQTFWNWISSSKKEKKVITILNNSKIFFTKKQNLDSASLQNFFKNKQGKHHTHSYQKPHFWLYPCVLPLIINVLFGIKLKYQENKKPKGYFHENQKSIKKELIIKYYLSISKFWDLFSSSQGRPIFFNETPSKIFEDFFLSSYCVKKKINFSEINSRINFESRLKYGEFAYQNYLTLKKHFSRGGNETFFKDLKWGLINKKKFRNSIIGPKITKSQEKKKESPFIRNSIGDEKIENKKQMLYLTKIFFFLVKSHVFYREEPSFIFLGKFSNINPIRLLFDMQHFFLGYEKYEILLEFFNHQKNLFPSLSHVLFKISKKKYQLMESMFEQTRVIMLENIAFVKLLDPPCFTVWVLERIFHLRGMYPGIIFKNFNQEKKPIFLGNTAKQFFTWNFGEFRKEHKLKISKRFETSMISNRISIALFFQLSKKILTQGFDVFSIELLTYFRFFSFSQLCPIIFMATKIFFKTGNIGESRCTLVQGVPFLNLLKPIKTEIFWKFWFFFELFLGSNVGSNSLNKLRVSFNFLSRHCFFRNSYL